MRRQVEAGKVMAVSARKQGKTWHDRGPTHRHARRLYLKYPLLPPVDLARILGVSRQVKYEYVEELEEEREKRREERTRQAEEEEGL